MKRKRNELTHDEMGGDRPADWTGWTGLALDEGSWRWAQSVKVVEKRTKR